MRRIRVSEGFAATLYVIGFTAAMIFGLTVVADYASAAYLLGFGGGKASARFWGAIAGTLCVFAWWVFLGSVSPRWPIEDFLSALRPWLGPPMGFHPLGSSAEAGDFVHWVDAATGEWRIGVVCCPLPGGGMVRQLGFRDGRGARSVLWSPEYMIVRPLDGRGDFATVPLDGDVLWEACVVFDSIFAEGPFEAAAPLK